VGLLLFAFSAWRAAGGIRPGWLVPAVGVFVQATGEVAAWTVTYGLVYRLAPPRAVAAVMGAFYALTLGLGAYLAGWLGTFAEQLGNDRYFLTLGLVTAIIALASLTLGAPIRSLAASSGAALEARTGSADP
jgi:dipeptide/tripeptide permease